ncbi:MAG: hypothetical protein HY259_07100 [Chloroflexi bacterium]|nr:hypothetical protein [Chloroflexota bacterium]MBI3733212.1 hypothetical protein [Chloroflexota bacterium]
MTASPHAVWEIAGHLRRIVAEMDTARTYPRLDLTPFVGLSSMQLQISGGTERERSQLAQTIQLRLRQRLPDMANAIAIRVEADQVVLIAGSARG